MAVKNTSIIKSTAPYKRQKTDIAKPAKGRKESFVTPLLIILETHSITIKAADKKTKNVEYLSIVSRIKRVSSEKLFSAKRTTRVIKETEKHKIRI